MLLRVDSSITLVRVSMEQKLTWAKPIMATTAPQTLREGELQQGACAPGLLRLDVLAQELRSI
jgi:hypothetical protein